MIHKILDFPKKNSFESILNDKRAIVWEEIQNYLKEFNLTIKKYTKGYKTIGTFHSNLVTEYPKRKGKYLRPSLLLLTTEAMGVDQKLAVKTAAAMQVSEDWILNHDDWEDGSLERRGKSALYKIFGPELAINGGDALHILMWKILYDNTLTLGPELTSEIINEFYQMLTRTTLGQTAEIKWTKDNKLDLSEKDWFFIADGKTAYYTIAGPMRLGAILAHATEKQLELLFKFGTFLGRCFQIQDDILDLTSNFRGLKKQQGNDIYEGKRTLILIHLLENANPRDRKTVESIMKKPRDQKNQNEVLKIIELMQHYKSIEYAQTVAKELAQKARKVFINDLTFLDHEPARSELLIGINFILQRDY